MFHIAMLLHCTLSLPAQCIVIGPVCGFVTVYVCVCVCVCVFVGVRGPVTTITRNCGHRFSPNCVYR